MRSAVTRWVLAMALAICLAGCVTPQGGAVSECGPDWEPVVLDGPSTITSPARTISIECYRVVREQRIEVGVLMPPGPECHAIDHVEIIENDEAVSLEVRIGRAASPLIGACPEEELPWGATVELNAPVAGRRVLDASVPTD